MKVAVVVSALLLLMLMSAGAEDLELQAKISHRKESHDLSNAGVVIWLTPIGREEHAEPVQNVKLVQKNKKFVPHLVVITMGTNLEFPNLDPFFHNVFSLYKGKRFDLGLYEAGSSRWVKFERPGVSFIFCNIHPEMSAAVVVLSTPYYAVSNAAGNTIIRDLPPGKYRMEVWYERSSPETLQPLTREISLPAAGNKISFDVVEAISDQTSHKNKHGQDYDRSKSYSPN